MRKLKLLLTSTLICVALPGLTLTAAWGAETVTSNNKRLKSTVTTAPETALATAEKPSRTKRKVSGGSRAMERFAQTADLLSVVQTCRRQGRSVIEFFQEALMAASVSGKPTPSLLPQPTTWILTASRGRGAKLFRAMNSLWYYGRAGQRLLGTVMNSANSNEQEFSATEASVFMDGFNWEMLLSDCLEENARRMSCFDNRLLQPQLLPGLAKIALSGFNLLPKRNRSPEEKNISSAETP